MWLVHETTLKGLNKILQDGYISPSSETKNLRLGENELDHVFMSVLFNDIKIVGYGETIDILIFFPLKIMEKYNPSHWSSDWVYGDFIETSDTDISIPYNKAKSSTENAKKWHTAFRQIHNKKIEYDFKNSRNEVIFKQKIPISEIAFVYLKKDPKFEVPNRVDTKQKLNKLIMGVK